jgi:hypothetical protein
LRDVYVCTLANEMRTGLLTLLLRLLLLSVLWRNQLLM